MHEAMVQNGVMHWVVVVVFVVVLEKIMMRMFSIITGLALEQKD